MGDKLDQPNESGGTTDHSAEILFLRLKITRHEDKHMILSYALAADLLQAHDESGISLDNWLAAREFVEYFVGHEIIDNGI